MKKKAKKKHKKESLNDLDKKLQKFSSDLLKKINEIDAIIISVKQKQKRKKK